MNNFTVIVAAVYLGIPALLILLRIIKWKGQSLLSILFGRISTKTIDKIASTVIQILFIFLYTLMFHITYAPFRLYKTGKVYIDTVTNTRPFLMTGGWPIITTDESRIAGQYASYKCDYEYASDIKIGQHIFVFCNIKNKTGLILQEKKPPTIFYIYTHYFTDVLGSIFMSIFCLFYLSFIPLIFLLLLIPKIKKIWSSSIIKEDNSIIKFSSVIKGFAPFTIIFLSSYYAFGLLFNIATSFEGKSDFVSTIIAFFSFNVLLFLPLIISSIKQFIESTTNIIVKTIVAVIKVFFTFLMIVSTWEVVAKEKVYLSDFPAIAKYLIKVIFTKEK